MSDTWAGILAVSVAIMALVQLAVLIGVAIAARRLMAVAHQTQQQLEHAAAEVKSTVNTVTTDLRATVNSVTSRVNAVADDVRGVTSRMQQVASTVSDGVQRVEHSVKSAGQKVADTVDQVPTSVKRGVPVGLAVLAALRTVQQVRSRLRQDRRDDRYAGANYPVDEYAS